MLQFKVELEERLQMIYNGILLLKQQGVPIDAIAPQAGIYLTVKIEVPDAHTLLLEHAGIGVLPFSVFGTAKDSPWYRISVGTCKKEDIKPMLEILRKVLCRITLD